MQRGHAAAIGEYNAQIMTLRDYLNRRNRRVLIPGAVITFIVFAFGVSESKGSTAQVIAGIAVPVFFVLIALFWSRSRCPKWGARLDYIGFGSRRRGRAPRIGLDRCKSCGLHLNEEIP